MDTQPNKAAALTAQIDRFIEDLATATDAARISEQMTKYLDTCAKFYKYSQGNQLLISWQRPDAEFIAGYNAWLKLNRYVKKGEKGIMILCPCPFTKDGTNAKGEAEKKTGVYFKVGYVFDITQTDGEPLPDAPAWKNPEQNLDLLNRLVLFAESKGIGFEIKPLEGETQGASSGGKITLSPTAGIKTMIHELAHELLHHGSNRHTFTTEQRELQAESIAYTVARALGLSSLNSSNYLALWGADTKTIRANLDTIRTTAAEILTAVMPQAAALEAE